MDSFKEQQRELKENLAKNVIFEATISILLEKGTDGLKMQEIAGRAGISTGSLYNYFKDRKDLLYYVDERLHNTALDVVAKYCCGSGPADQRLALMIEELLEFCSKHYVVFDLAEKMSLKDMIPIEVKQERHQRAMDYVTQLLQGGIQQGIFHIQDVQLVARMFFISIIGTFEVRNCVSDYDIKPYQDGLTKFYLSYLTMGKK